MEEMTDRGNGRMLISVDVMGGDHGPMTILDGIALAAKKYPDVEFILHGPERELKQIVGKRKNLQSRCEIRDATNMVSMGDKPSIAARHAEGTSMWSALEAVRTGEASACFSCGNTGALAMLSVLRLKRLPGINRPAIAILWPSKNPQGHTIMLDGGADISADAQDLLQYALMGTTYARFGYGLSRPRVGLLNVGTEKHKGTQELGKAYGLIDNSAGNAEFDFMGFIEGMNIPGDLCDVVITDGFTGNVAIKASEGTAELILGFLRDAFNFTPLSRIAALLAYTSLRRMKKRIDPRRSNGGVFLGVNGTVIKSHGSADAVGVSAAIKLACKLARSNFNSKLATTVSSFALQKPNASNSISAKENCR
ncbi:MAG: phosphate acyltransferase PlsX [Roseovarius sp.]|nr:phosphate acyltransferase PlsX [Roseovarius sp.]MCY4315234.1 phosphate acyltransferase PlsX [Roseovarius sp.]